MGTAYLRDEYSHVASLHPVVQFLVGIKCTQIELRARQWPVQTRWHLQHPFSPNPLAYRLAKGHIEHGLLRERARTESVPSHLLALQAEVVPLPSQESCWKGSAAWFSVPHQKTLQQWLRQAAGLLKETSGKGNLKFSERPQELNIFKLFLQLSGENRS